MRINVLTSFLIKYTCSSLLANVKDDVNDADKAISYLLLNQLVLGLQPHLGHPTTDRPLINLHTPHLFDTQMITFSQYLLSRLASLTSSTLGSWKTLESGSTSRSLLSSLTLNSLQMHKGGTVRADYMEL